MTVCPLKRQCNRRGDICITLACLVHLVDRGQARSKHKVRGSSVRLRLQQLCFNKAVESRDRLIVSSEYSFVCHAANR